MLAVDHSGYQGDPTMAASDGGEIIKTIRSNCTARMISRYKVRLGMGSVQPKTANSRLLLETGRVEIHPSDSGQFVIPPS